jgi:hypothetical protein
MTPTGHSVAPGNSISRALISKNKALGECQFVSEHPGLHCTHPTNVAFELQCSPTLVVYEPHSSSVEAPSSAPMVVPYEAPTDVPPVEVSPGMPSVQVTCPPLFIIMEAHSRAPMVVPYKVPTDVPPIEVSPDVPSIETDRPLLFDGPDPCCQPTTAEPPSIYSMVVSTLPPHIGTPIVFAHDCTLQGPSIGSTRECPQGGTSPGPPLYDQTTPTECADATQRLHQRQCRCAIQPESPVCLD